MMKGFRSGSLGSLEFWGINTLPHRLFHKYVQFPIFKGLLKKQHIDLTGASILDAGCGSGYEAELILREFEPRKLVAFDFSPQQILIARQRNDRLKLDIEFSEGDLTQLQLPDGEFDAVVAVNMLHHVSDRQQALAEAARVLKPQGVLLMNELSHAWSGWDELTEGLESAGFVVLASRKYLLGLFQSFLCRKEAGAGEA